MEIPVWDLLESTLLITRELSFEVTYETVQFCCESILVLGMTYRHPKND